MKNIYYKTIEKNLVNHTAAKKHINILEIGCGEKIYKKLFKKFKYCGLDLPDSKWIDNNDRPEIESKLSNVNDFENFDLIFSVATIYLLDNEDIETLIKLIFNLKKTKGKILIFDYKKKTIDKLGSKQNDYETILRKTFNGNFKLRNIEWCSNNILKKSVKEKLNINTSHIIEINFEK